MLNSPAARAEPVEPPDTRAWARPSATARVAYTIDASGVERTANAGYWALAMETGASTTSTPAGTGSISPAGPNSSTPVPRSAAMAAPAATSAGPRSAPPASTATRTIARPLALGGGLTRLRFYDLAPFVVAAYRTDPVRQSGAVALGARVVRRGADLVLRPAAGCAGMGLLLFGDSHCHGSVPRALADPRLGARRGYWRRSSESLAQRWSGWRWPCPWSGPAAFKSAPHSAHRPAQSERHRTCAGNDSASASRAQARRSRTSPSR